MLSTSECARRQAAVALSVSLLIRLRIASRSVFSSGLPTIADDGCGSKPATRRREVAWIDLRIHRGVRKGLRTSSPEKCFSLSVTIMHSFVSATAATIISKSLLGFPAARPSDMRRAQASAAFSSNGNILPLNSDCGPSGPANHASNRSRFLPFGLSSMPRRISAIVREEMNKSPSDCTPIHSNNDSDGSGFVILLIMFVSRR